MVFPRLSRAKPSCRKLNRHLTDGGTIPCRHEYLTEVIDVARERKAIRETNDR